MTNPDEPSLECRDRSELRADAARNRGRIVAAAREVFGEDGVDAPLDEIARRAEVGIATLYRRFPARSDLLAAAFEARMAAHADAVAAALAADDPWEGFSGLVRSVCGLQAADRGMRDVLTMTFPPGTTCEGQRVRAYGGTVELIRRAQAQGSLRPDFVPEDLVILLMANAGVVNASGRAAPDAWQRLVAYLLEAFRARKDQGELPPPPAPRQIALALGRQSRSSPAHGERHAREHP